MSCRKAGFGRRSRLGRLKEEKTALELGSRNRGSDGPRKKDDPRGLSGPFCCWDKIVVRAALLGRDPVSNIVPQHATIDTEPHVNVRTGLMKYLCIISYAQVCKSACDSNICVPLPC